MKLPEIVRYALGSIEVVESNNVVTVSGLRQYVMTIDIINAYGTRRLVDNMFIEVSDFGFKIDSFFIPDLYHVIQDLIEDSKLGIRKYGTSLRSLTLLLKKLKENTWIKNTFSEAKGTAVDFSKMNTLKWKPLDFQAEFLQFYSDTTEKYKLHGQLFAAAAGGGKTFTSMALGEGVGAKTIIVIAPLNAVNRVWESSVKEIYKKIPTYWVSNGNKQLTGKERYIILHYQWLDKLIALTRLIHKKDLYLILDESHNLNELTATRTRSFIELCDILKPKNVLMLSGTPIKARSIETLPLLKVIDPMFTDDVMERFIKVFKGTNNSYTDFIKRRLGIVSFTVEKSVFKLEEPIVNTVSVKFDGGDEFTITNVKKVMVLFTSERLNYYKERSKVDLDRFNSIIESVRQKIQPYQEDDLNDYLRLVDVIKNHSGGLNFIVDEIRESNKYEKELIFPLLENSTKKEFRKIKSLVKYVRLVVQGECLGRILGKLRIDCHVAIVKNLDFKPILEGTTKKTVVFSNNVKVLEAVMANTLQYSSPIGVFGKHTKNLASIVKDFGDIDELNPLAATYAALSTAVPLVMADTVVLIDRPYRSYILEQAISRVHRLGSDTQTKVWYIKLDTGDEPNLSGRIDQILTLIQNSVEEITGVKSPYSVEETIAMESDMYPELIHDVLSKKITPTKYLNW